MGLDRAKKAGHVLADALINRAQGNRPVTLIGYSLGARVIFYCLEELLLRSETDPSIFDIVENAILLGAPVTTDKPRWEGIRTLCTGRLVNGYIQNDWVLSFLHRTMNYGKPVAGNVDLPQYWHRVSVKDPLDEDEENDDDSKSLSSENSDPREEEDLNYTSEAMSSFNADTTFKLDNANTSNGVNSNVVESINLSGIVEGHLDYRNQIQIILARLKLNVMDPIVQADPKVLFETTFTL